MSRRRYGAIAAICLALCFATSYMVSGPMAQTSSDRPVWDSAVFTWQTTDTLIKGGWINDQYQSGVLDFRNLGNVKTLYIRGTTSSGSPAPTFYVAIDGKYSSTNDSLNFFRFALGASQPTGCALTPTSGTFRALYGSVAMDSTHTQASWTMSLTDSVTGAPFDCPYGRLHVWTAGQKVDNVWLIIKSRSK